ncbi:MAG TPA: TonB-dependent receptor [Pedomonas sp.]|uniref:TonB-dependent receptor n=1 Tax=Pedomonas sp. TaxID=2976421 RepID=UPI002F3EE287
MSAFRAVLKAGVATAIVASAAPAFAQDQGASMDTIVVTGSRIARPELKASSPVAVVGAEEFKFSGATHVEEVLNELPQVVPSLTGASNNPGDGVATVDLRGLGEERTLVLVNGRRYVAYDEQQIVDINTVPAALIERVDVVTGGRSAIYGSDAIAGVVNFVLKKDFEGAQISGNYRLNEAGDGDTYTVDGVIGSNFADGKGNVTAYMSYSKRKAIMAGARSYTRTALGDSADGTQVEFAGSPAIQGSRVNIPGLGWQKFDADGNLSPYAGNSDSYNFAPDNYLQTPNERWFVGAFANYEINDHFKVFSEFQYINSRSKTWLAPTPVSNENINIHIASPFLSDATRATLTGLDTDGDGYVRANLSGRRMSESGGRIQEDDRNAFRALIGLEGEIAGNWSYETYYSYARNRNVQTQEGNISRTKFHEAVETAFDASGNLVCRSESARANGCVPLNIYGPGVASADGINYVTIGSSNLNKIESQVASFVVSNGELFDLGAGPAGIALGAEWRSEKGSYRPDTFLSSGDVIGFNAGSPTSGSYNVKELFGEVVVPLLADLPFAQNVEFNGALRYSDYSNAVGSTWAYSAGLMWAPVEDITFRGQYQRAVRAPTVYQLFQGNAVGYPAATDPCNLDVAKTNPTLNATCAGQGLTPAQIGSGDLQAGTQIRTISGGNPDLTEEKADTYTIGAVIQPTFLPRFTLTVDYYNISIDDYISTPGTVSIIAACYGNSDSNYTPFDSSLCALAPRDSAGQLNDVMNTRANLGELKTSGVDFEARYFVNVPFGVESEGRLDFRLTGTRLINWQLNTMASIPDLMIDCDGTFGLNCGDPMPKWRGSFRTTYSTGPFSASLAWKYVGKVNDDDDTYDFAVEKVKSYSLFDLAFSYDVNETLSFTTGVNNLFDKKPPLMGDNNQQSNTYPSTYDVFGRQYFFSATARF